MKHAVNHYDFMVEKKKEQFMKKVKKKQLWDQLQRESMSPCQSMEKDATVLFQQLEVDMNQKENLMEELARWEETLLHTRC